MTFRLPRHLIRLSRRSPLLAVAFGVLFLSGQFTALSGVGLAYSPALLGDALCSSHATTDSRSPEPQTGAAASHLCCLLCQGLPYTTLPSPGLSVLPAGVALRRHRVVPRRFCRHVRRGWLRHPPRAPP